MKKILMIMVVLLCIVSCVDKGEMHFYEYTVSYTIDGVPFEYTDIDSTKMVGTPSLDVGGHYIIFHLLSEKIMKPSKTIYRGTLPVEVTGFKYKEIKDE